MLLEAAVGDGYGGAFEYSPQSFIDQHNTGQYYSKHPRHNVPPGWYTDDTQMSLAIAELLISDLEWNRLNLANKFVEVFKRDPREGYAKGFYQFLLQVESGKEFLETIGGKSDKSGGAMRTTPIGLLQDFNEIMEKTILQASITHNSPAGLAAAQAAVALVYYCNQNLGSLEDASKWINEQVAGDWLTPWEGKVKTKGWMSVGAAITAFCRNDNLTDLLIDCIDFRGDVDTVATIALAAASVSDQYEQNLSEVLLLGLENRAYGRDYIIALDEKLRII